MPKVLRHTLLSARDLLVTAGPFLLVAMVLLVVAYFALDPTPPKKVVLATGPDQGAYAEFGKRYAAALKQRGIEVQLRTTAGAAENLRLLLDPKSGVDIAFLQGGAGEKARSQADADALVSLGSLFYEPVWLFYREDSAKRLLKADALASLTQLAGWKVNIGARGSGAANLARKMLDANHVDASTITMLRLDQTPAVMSLLAGEIDALVFASAPESLMVQMLLQTPGVKLYDFAQSEAYSRRFPFMSPVILPRGVVDLAKDVPPADVRLVAPTAALAAQRDTHPALLQLFVQAAQAIHGEAGWFQRKGEFPGAKNTEWPLSKEAERFYRSGPPLLQQYLPFWLANLIDRMWVALVSIIAILIPMSRIVPPLYEFRIRSRIFRWYGQLRAVENEQGERDTGALMKELDSIEQRVGNVTVPLSYADELYALRSHINLVRRRLQQPENLVEGKA
jgi:ABC-type nitrate/sulfonate/bicarbonate transport system substrate-binding protein